jgi:hypothetical protein
MAVLAQDIVGFQRQQDGAALIGDLEPAAVQRAAMQQCLAQYFTIGAYRFLAGRFQAGQFLALDIGAEAFAVPHMEEVSGHRKVP